MPTYQYVCTDCGQELEVAQKFTDDALVECPVCGGRLRKVFYPVGVVFKGSGFYSNDSRKPAKEAAATGAGKGSAESKSEGTTTKPSSSTDGGSKPTKSAPTKATTSAA